MKIKIFQHVPFENAGSIEDWARARGFECKTTRLFAGDALPKLTDGDILVVMGGPMNIYETEIYPWLTPEKEAIRAAIDEGIPVIGICLGAQLIADTIGAKVTRNSEKEIGWFPVRLTQKTLSDPLFKGFPQSFDAFHWHGDTFSIPEGATAMGESDATKNQGFIVRNGTQLAVGFQFHLESTELSIRRLIENCSDELIDARYIQKKDKLSKDTSEINRLMAQFMDNLSVR